MVYGLPAPGEENWSTKLDASIEAVKDTADAAKTTADAALPAVQKGAASGVAPLDAGGLLPEANVPTRLTEASLDATIATQVDPIEPDGGVRAVGKGELALNARDYGVVGDGIANDTTALQAALTAAGNAVALGVKTALAPAGTFSINTPLTVPAGVEFRLDSGAVIKNTVATQSAIKMSAGSTLRGPGKISSPATWDGTNVAWTYAVVEVLGDDCEVSGVRLDNVPRVGIGIKDGDSCRIIGNHITGNYPAAQWTGVETVHFGITLDPSISATAGNLVVTGNVVESCVQGVFTGPYDGGGPAKGVTISGNTFEGCWNHGVYAYGRSITISGNSFNRCQIPVATSGPRMSIIGNTMHAEITGTDQRDIAGISCREPIGCVVANNTIRGNAPAGSVIIDIRCSDTTTCTDNIVHDNTIYVEGGTSQAIRVGVNATTCENNSIHDNVIRSVGAPGLGVIHMTAATTGSLGLDNRVTNNTVVMRGDTHGIYVTRQDGCIVAGNKVRLEYDAPTAKTLGMVALNTDTARTEVRHNSFKVTAAWGANVALRAVYEFAGVTDNVYRDNEYRLDTTKLTSATRLFVQGGSRIHESGPGAPTIAATPGSTWLNTSGGAATTFYVKESGTGSTGWVGK